MADLLQLMVEAERRGILPPDKTALLAEARRRGLVPSGEQKPPEPAPSVGGMGGYNPFARRFMGAGEQGMERLGLTPENVQNPVANAAGPLEAVAQIGTGTVGTIAGGLAGITQALRNMASRDPTNMSAANRVAQVQDALTYQPRTGVGAGMSRVVSIPGEVYGAATNRVGEAVTDVTGSPALGAAVKTVGDVAPAVIGMRTSKVQRPQVQPKRTGEYQRPPEPGVPTSADLADAKNAAYKSAEDAGVVIRPESTQRVVDMMNLVAKKENLGKLPTKLKEAHDVLAERIAANEPLSLMDADKVRQLIGDAFKSTDPADRRLAAIVKNRYDDYLSGLKETDTLAGNSPDALAKLDMARGLFRRMRNSEMIDQAIKTAARKGEGNYTQAGVEHALRKEFEKIAARDDKKKFLSKEERAAIDRIVAPGKAANALRNLAKFDPAKGGMGATLGGIVGGGAGAALGGTLGGGVGAAAFPVAAHVAARLARKGTERRVSQAREALVGRGMPTSTQRTTAPTTQPSAARPRTPEEVKARVQAKSLEKVQSDIQRLLAEAERLQAELGSARQGGSRDK